MKVLVEMPDKLYEDCIFMKDIQEKQLEHNNAFKARSLLELQLVNCIANGTPLPKGHWNFVSKVGFVCSNCCTIHSNGRDNYCPNCGADMRGNEDEEVGG